jgi:hypothetical protein
MPRYAVNATPRDVNLLFLARKSVLWRVTAPSGWMEAKSRAYQEPTPGGPGPGSGWRRGRRGLVSSTRPWASHPVFLIYAGSPAYQVYAGVRSARAFDNLRDIRSPKV